LKISILITAFRNPRRGRGSAAAMAGIATVATITDIKMSFANAESSLFQNAKTRKSP
jgi:hypothetical protein